MPKPMLKTAPRHFLLLCCLTLPLTAQARSDAQLRLSPEQAATTTVTLTLGPGALATLDFPEAVTDVKVTRADLLDRAVEGSRVYLVGKTGFGSTPLVIVTESQQYIWRVNLKPEAAAAIVSVKVSEPEAGLPQPAPAPAPASNQAARPGIPLTAEEKPDIKIDIMQDGPNTLLQYRLQAGVRGLSIDERKLQVLSPGGALLTKTNLASMVLAPGQVRYGTVLLSSKDFGPDLKIAWPYRVGLKEDRYERALP